MSLEHQHKERSTKMNDSVCNIQQKGTETDKSRTTARYSTHLSVTDKAVTKL